MAEKYIDVSQAIYRLYGEHLSTLKVRSLIHCGETARDYGLWVELSSNLFEDLNGYITRVTHGTSCAQDEMGCIWRYLYVVE